MDYRVSDREIADYGWMSKHEEKCGGSRPVERSKYHRGMPRAVRKAQFEAGGVEHVCAKCGASDDMLLAIGCINENCNGSSLVRSTLANGRRYVWRSLGDNEVEFDG